jgi:hypothetical protein
MIYCVMARQATTVTLSESDRQELEKWVNAHRTPQQVAQRCRIVLAPVVYETLH